MYDEMNGSADSTENSAQAAETGSQQSGYYQQDSSSQQGVYTQNTYDYYATEENRQPEGGAGFGIASLVLGILALITFCTLCLNIPLAILAIIFAIIQLVKGNGKGLAIGGLITSVLSVVACLVFYFVVGLNAAKFSDLTDMDSLMQQYPELYQDLEDYGYDVDDFDYDDSDDDDTF